MPDPKQQIDASLGSGFYDEWKQMDADLGNENNRFDSIRRLLNLPFSPIFDRAYDDFRTVNDIARDYQQGMSLILAGRAVNVGKLKEIHDLYTLALGVAENDNDLLEAFWGSGFAAAWVIFPFTLLQAKSNAMLAALKELKKELAEAEHEVNKAVWKRRIHLVVSFVEAMFPEISLTGRAALYLGDVILDKALGPKNTSTAQKYFGDVNPGVKQFSEAVHHIEAYGETAKGVFEWTGKASTVATFYVDFEEIGEGEERVEKLKSLMEKVKDAYDALHKTIEDNKSKLMAFLAAFDRVVLAIESVRINGDNIRQALVDDAAKYRYPRGAAASWLAVP